MYYNENNAWKSKNLISQQIFYNTNVNLKTNVIQLVRISSSYTFGEVEHGFDSLHAQSHNNGDSCQFHLQKCYGLLTSTGSNVNWLWLLLAIPYKLLGFAEIIVFLSLNLSSFQI